jgi:hypothetical protein
MSITKYSIEIGSGKIPSLFAILIGAQRSQLPIPRQNQCKSDFIKTDPNKLFPNRDEFLCVTIGALDLSTGINRRCR